MQQALQRLYAWRDRILDHAGLSPGEVLLDVGCGDGLVAFGALNRVPDCRVIFSDISQDLLDHSRELAGQMGLLPRCRFVHAPADDLSSIPDTSVDVVTTRSVLIYVAAKERAFAEFYRVLKPGGRISIFEPINRFAFPEPHGFFGGYDVTPVQELAGRVMAVYERLQPADSDPMLDFDERDLLSFAEQAGFSEIHLEYIANIQPPKPVIPWEAFLQTPPNPKIPSPGEAIAQALTSEEADRFIAHLRPLVEAGKATERMAVAFLWAVKT
jgi:ubiquinone/menaquinone biosynthesis C-methylase UbiE